MTAIVVHREDRDTGLDPFAPPQRDDYGFRRQQRNVAVTTRETVKHGFRENGRPFLVSSTANHYKGWSITGKKFSRWATDSVTVIDVTKDGAWFSRGKAPKTGWNSHLMFAETPPVGRLEPYLHLLGDGPTSMWDHYPTLEHYIQRKGMERYLRRAFGPGSPVWGGDNEFRRRFVGARDARELTVSLFGATRVRRDLVKAVGGASIQNVYAAWQFRGLVPVDWLVGMMRDGFGDKLPAVYENSLAALNMRPQVRALDQQSLRNLTRDQMPNNYMMRDLSRMHRDVSPRRVRGWHDLHDALDDYRRTYGPPVPKNAKPKRPIRLRPNVAALEGTTAGGLTVEIARHEDDLWAWGLEMKHCIGGYGPQMRSRSTILGAVRDPGGRMVGNFEMGCQFFSQMEDDDPTEVWTLNQMLGHSNGSLPDPLREDMEAYLRGFDVQIGRYWGAAERPAPRAWRNQGQQPGAPAIVQAADADQQAWDDHLDDDFLAGMEAFEAELVAQEAAHPAHQPVQQVAQPEPAFPF
jgi:hypothetical protein